MATRFFFLLLCILSILTVPHAFCQDVLAPVPDAIPKEVDSKLDLPHSVRDYERCDWLVTYRNRTYDLAPLTRGSLSRPLDGDIRAVIRRDPTAGEHLNQVEREARLAKTHSIIGSAGITTFLLSRIARNDPNTRTHQGKQRSIDLIGLVGLVLFVKSTFDSHSAIEEANSQLAQAVDAFNQSSPHKIKPHKDEN